MRLHKLGLIAAVALGSLLVCANVSSAQNAGQGKRKGSSPQARVERMTTELNLTDTQKPKVLAVFQENSKKIRELRSETNLSRDERREKMTAIRKASNGKLKSILNSDQWAKYQKQLKELRKKGGRKNRGR